MNEVEVKLLEIDVKNTIKKLEKLGAKKSSEGDIQARYYDFPGKELKKAGCILRLRQKGAECELATKVKNSDDESVKSRDETETIVSDFEAARKILLNLGLRETSSEKKHRVSYTSGNVHFEFDTLPSLPTFLEIEANSAEEVKKWVVKLGFSMSDAKPWSGKDVREHYGKK